MTKTILYINIVLSVHHFQAVIKALLSGTKSEAFVNNCTDILYEKRKKCPCLQYYRQMV